MHEYWAHLYAPFKAQEVYRVTLWTSTDRQQAESKNSAVIGEDALADLEVDARAPLHPTPPTPPTPPHPTDSYSNVG